MVASFSVQQMVEAEAYAAQSDFEAAQVALNMVDTVYHLQSPTVQAHGESASVFHSSKSMMDDMTVHQDDYRSFGSKRTRQTVELHRKQRSSATSTPMRPATYGGAVPAAAGSASSVSSPYETKSKKAWRNKFGS